MFLLRELSNNFVPLKHTFGYYAEKIEKSITLMSLENYKVSLGEVTLFGLLTFDSCYGRKATLYF